MATSLGTILAAQPGFCLLPNASLPTTTTGIGLGAVGRTCTLEAGEINTSHSTLPEKRKIVPSLEMRNLFDFMESICERTQKENERISNWLSYGSIIQTTYVGKETCGNIAETVET